MEKSILSTGQEELESDEAEHLEPAAGTPANESTESISNLIRNAWDMLGRKGETMVNHGK